jgi:antitoxin component YwqK of YwqJK toxin-antitoxin module
MKMLRLATFPLLGFFLHVGCAPTQKGLPNAPIFNTGVRGTVIMPGQSAPVMPGSRMPGAPVPVPQAGSTSGSASGSWSGYPGGPNAPPPGTPPSAYGSPYGNPNDISMIGGAVTVDTREVKRPRNALSNNPIFWPFGIVAWPVHKLVEAVDDKDDQETLDRRAQAIVESGGAPTYLGKSPRQQAQLAQEYAQNEAMERELAQRQGGDGAPTPQSYASAPAPGGASSSIAEELEALRKRAPARPTAPGGAPVAQGANDAEDRDGDGQVDRWVFERDGKLAREVFDDDGDGRPDRTVYYDADGKTPLRAESDGDRDGATDSWVVYQGGKMSQRRSDSNQDGQVDAWIFYDESGRIARQAQDTDGDGTRDRAELFEDGKLARRTEDLDGDGRPDRTTRFDAKGNAIETEEDKDGDGQIDVRSYYERGKLVKRQLLDEEAQGATP